MTTPSNSRRAFFLQGSAVLGAGVATTAGAAAILPGNAATLQEQVQTLQQQLDKATDREAIRRLHLAYTESIESQSYGEAAELFDDRAQLHLSGLNATGRPAIQRLFSDQYRELKAAVIHSAYRQSAPHSGAITLSADRQQAKGIFPVDVELSTPLQADSTAAKMARLQGFMASRCWESGRLEAEYVKTRGQWKMASLSYIANQSGS